MERIERTFINLLLVLGNIFSSHVFGIFNRMLAILELPPLRRVRCLPLQYLCFGGIPHLCFNFFPLATELCIPLYFQHLKLNVVRGYVNLV